MQEGLLLFMYILYILYAMCWKLEGSYRLDQVAVPTSSFVSQSPGGFKASWLNEQTKHFCQPILKPRKITYKLRQGPFPKKLIKMEHPTSNHQLYLPRVLLQHWSHRPAASSSLRLFRPRSHCSARRRVDIRNNDMASLWPKAKVGGLGCLKLSLHKQKQTTQPWHMA